MVDQATSKKIYTEVVEESSRGKKVLGRYRPGEKLTLDLLPDDQNKAKVIRVMRHSGEVLGHLKQDVWDKVAPELEAGSKVEATVLLVTEGKPPSDFSGPRRFFSKPARHCYIKITF